MTEVFVHLHHPPYHTNSHFWGDWDCSFLGKSDCVKMHPILHFWENASHLTSQFSLWDHSGERRQYWAEPAKPFFDLYWLPRAPTMPGAVKDNQSTAHSQFSWEGGHQERLAEEQLLRLTIPQVPIKAVQKGISQPVQLALAYLLRNASADL